MSEISDEPKLWEGKNRSKLLLPRPVTSASAGEPELWEGRNRSRLFEAEETVPKDFEDSRADIAATIVVFVCVFLMVIHYATS